MAVVVAHDIRSDFSPISMSNGLAAVFISVLSIAASLLAKNDREKEIAVWLASHDQGAFGLGVVNFDVSDCPWDEATFDQDKAFLLSVIRAAGLRHGWSKLDYNPREDWVKRCLSEFEELVQRFGVEHVVPPVEQVWYFGEKPAKFELCAIHGVYLHSHGCILCNDA